MKKFLVFIAFAGALMLSACASAPISVVSFKVLDRQTNEEIKDYRIRVQGHGVEAELKAGETIELSNGAFKPPIYTADIEADGYSKNSSHKLQSQYCSSCSKSFGVAKTQTIYMDKIGSSSTDAPSEETQPEEANQNQ